MSVDPNPGVDVLLDIPEDQPALGANQIAEFVAAYSGLNPKQFAEAEVSLTLRMAEEAERSVTSICWHFPEYLGLVQRELDPRVHFTSRAHQLVLEAIALVSEKCQAVDWSSVLVSVCEIPGAFEECGQREGLNAIFTDANRYPEGPRAELAQLILRDRIGFLKKAALVRGTDPSKAGRALCRRLGAFRKEQVGLPSRASCRDRSSRLSLLRQNRRAGRMARGRSSHETQSHTRKEEQIMSVWEEITGEEDQLDTKAKKSTYWTMGKRLSDN